MEDIKISQSQPVSPFQSINSAEKIKDTGKVPIMALGEGNSYGPVVVEEDDPSLGAKAQVDVAQTPAMSPKSSGGSQFEQVARSETAGLHDLDVQGALGRDDDEDIFASRFASLGLPAFAALQPTELTPSYGGDDNSPPPGPPPSNYDLTLNGTAGRDAILTQEMYQSALDNDEYDYADDYNVTTYAASAGDVEIHGGNGDDLIFGSTGNDALHGDGGDDEIYGGDGDDEIYGGTGADSLYGGSGNDTLHGGDGDDYLEGNDGDDILNGGGGDDTLRGNDGNDTLNGGDGNDTLNGGDGDDILNGDAGNDYLYGENDNDILNGGLGHDRLFGGAGDDILDGGDGNDFLLGEAGDDLLTGSAGNDTFAFTGNLNGHDTVTDFVDGEDTVQIRSTVMFSALMAASGNDFTNFGAHLADYITLVDNGGDVDIIIDVDGAGMVHSQQTVATLTGMAGLTLQDLIDSNSIVVTNNSGKIELSGVSDNYDLSAYRTDLSINAGNGDDTIVGGSGRDEILGGNGMDTIYGGDGDDYISGGNDNDTLEGGDGDDHLDGGDGTDTLRGGDGDDYLYGNSGDDTLEGGNGNDFLYGGDGNDFLIGGAGADRFLLDPGDIGIDEIQDFELGTDQIVINDYTLEYDTEIGLMIANYIRLTDNAGDVLVEIDTDGTGNSESFHVVATITGMAGMTLQDLLDAGSLYINYDNPG